MQSNILNTVLYEGCGNMVLIVVVDMFDRKDIELCRHLRDIGLAQDADSVLVVTGDPRKRDVQGYDVTMDVFEPRGGDKGLGSWSTMCGNGIRALARYLVDRKLVVGEVAVIKTGSGIRHIDILPDNLFRVAMGQFTTEQKDMLRYVASFDLESLAKAAGIETSVIFAGLNGDLSDGTIDGEPHLVFVLKAESIKLGELKNMAERVGERTTLNKNYFPQGINTNIVSIVLRSEEVMEVNACTYERGINYVTQACGTGATAIGSWFMTNNPNLTKVVVNMLGGTLTIEKEGDIFYMTGPAHPVI